MARELQFILAIALLLLCASNVWILLMLQEDRTQEAESTFLGREVPRGASTGELEVQIQILRADVTSLERAILRLLEVPSESASHVAVHDSTSIRTAADTASLANEERRGLLRPEIQRTLAEHKVREGFIESLGRLAALRGSVDAAVLRRAALEHLAQFLRLEPAEAEAFVDTGLGLSQILESADEEYAEVQKTAYREAGNDWTRVKIPDEAQARWEAAYSQAQAELGRFLRPGLDPRHKWFTEEHQARFFLLSHLSRTQGSFRWE